MVGARTARPGRGGSPRDVRLGDAGHQAGLGIQLPTTSPGSTSASACCSTAGGTGARIRSPRRRTSEADGKLISITVKAMPEGQLSIAPGQRRAVGDDRAALTHRRATSRCPTPPPEKILFLTAGSGLTPVIAMLRTMNRRGQLPDVVHVHSAPTDARTCCSPTSSTQLAATYDNFVSHVQLTRKQGQFASTSLDAAVPRLARTPDVGLRPDRDARRDRDVAGSAKDSRQAAHRAVRDLARRCRRRGRHRDVRPVRTRSGPPTARRTLLQAGEAVGVQMPFGCRMGICQTCVVPLTEGAVRDLRSGPAAPRG